MFVLKNNDLAIIDNSGAINELQISGVEISTKKKRLYRATKIK